MSGKMVNVSNKLGLSWAKLNSSLANYARGTNCFQLDCLTFENYQYRKTFTQSIRNSSNIVALCYNSVILIVYFDDFWVAECMNCVIVIIIIILISQCLF